MHKLSTARISPRSYPHEWHFSTRIFSLHLLGRHRTRCVSSSPNNTQHVFHDQKKMERITRAQFEVEVQVEVSRGCILRVYEYCSSANYVCSDRGSQQRVLKQCWSDSLSLDRDVDGEPCQQDNRNRMPRQTFPDALASRLVADSPGSERVVARHDRALRQNIGLRALRLLARPGEALQETVELVLSAVEWLEVMTSPQLLYGVGRGHSRTLGVVSNCSRRGRDFRESSAAANASY